LRQGDDHSVLGGAEEVLINPLEPGEQQTVTVMQQAPDYVSILVWGPEITVPDLWCRQELLHVRPARNI